MASRLSRSKTGESLRRASGAPDRVRRRRRSTATLEPAAAAAGWPERPEPIAGLECYGCLPDPLDLDLVEDATTDISV